MNPEHLAEIDDLNLQRAAHPLDPVIARRWCNMAFQLGQAHKVKSYAAQFYAAETKPLRQSEWARLAGQAALCGLKLEDALASFTVSLGHLCEMGEVGRVPVPNPGQNVIQAFGSGQAEELLWTTGASLAQAGFTAFPFAGTLLGLVREGRLLEFDKDIDLGLWIEDFKSCCNWLSSHGWIRIRAVPPYKDFAAFMDPRSNLTLDICGFKRIPSELAVEGGFHLEGYPQQYQSTRRFPWIELQARPTPAGDVWFIREPEPILAALYGDWLTPNPWWDGMISSHAMSEFTLLVRCYAYDRLLFRWSSGQIDRAWAYAHQIALKDSTDFVSIRAKKCLGQILAKINPDALIWPPKSTQRSKT